MCFHVFIWRRLFSSSSSLPPSPLFFFKSNKGKRPRLLFARTLNQCPHGHPSVRPAGRPSAPQIPFQT